MVHLWDGGVTCILTQLSIGVFTRNARVLPEQGPNALRVPV